MSKSTIAVKWNGAKDDPDSITQYGHVFEKGEWTKIPSDHPRLDKFKGNPYFEVKGSDNDLEPSDAHVAGAAAMPPSGPVYGPGSTYKPWAVKDSKGKTTAWIVVGKDNKPVPNGDEYTDESSAQVVADGMNKVAP